MALEMQHFRATGESAGGIDASSAVAALPAGREHLAGRGLTRDGTANCWVGGGTGAESNHHQQPHNHERTHRMMHATYRGVDSNCAGAIRSSGARVAQTIRRCALWNVNEPFAAGTAGSPRQTSATRISRPTFHDLLISPSAVLTASKDC